MSNTFTPRIIPPTQNRRFYQEAFLAHVHTHFRTDEVSKKILYSSPTGTGKSYMFLDALGSDPFAWGITNRLEIISGMLAKCGEDVENLSVNKLVDLAFEYRISTPVRFRNMLAKGELPFLPWRLYIDECHHAIADTYKDIMAYLPAVSIAGLTATPFRGTPKSTREFMGLWDKHVEILNIGQAIEHGYWEVPEATIWPLVDDDEIEVTNGEFTATNAGNAGITRSADLVQRIVAAGWVRMRILSDPITEDIGELYTWDKPTIFAVSTREQAYDLHDRCSQANIPTTVVVQDTNRNDREEAFRSCVNCHTAIIQIDVASEGVDLPIRRIIDMRPTFSPVRWLQLFGRETRKRPLDADGRPIGPISEYICCNRNLERHCYLLNGAIPPSKVAEAQTVFGGQQSRRSSTRAVGMENLGRLRPVSIKFLDGTVGQVYNLFSIKDYDKREIAVVLHPAMSEPVVAERVNTKDPQTNEYKYGSWKQLDSIPDVVGYASASGGVITDKQAASWKAHAHKYGLDSSVTPTRKSIQAYYLLRDLRCFRLATTRRGYL